MKDYIKTHIKTVYTKCLLRLVVLRVRAVLFVLYGPYCQGALKLDLNSTLFVTLIF